MQNKLYLYLMVLQCLLHHEILKFENLSDNTSMY